MTSSSKPIQSAFRNKAIPLYFIPYRRLVQPRWPDAWPLEHLSLAILVAWPIVGIVFSDAGSGHAWRLASLLLVDYLILEAVLAAWHKYDRAAGALDLALLERQNEAERLTKHLERGMSPVKQILFCMVIGAAFSLAVFLPARTLVLPTAFAYLTCASTGIVVGQALYLNIATILLARQIRDSESLEINSIRPRQSQGISELSRAVQAHAKAGLILVAVVMIPVTLGYLKSRSIHELVILLAMASLGPVSVIAIGFTVQMWIYEPPRRTAESTFEDLVKRVASDYDVLLHDGADQLALNRLDMRLKVLSVLEEDDVPFYGKGRVWQYFVIALPILAQVAVALTSKFG